MARSSKSITTSSAILSREPFKLYIRIEGDLPKATNQLLGKHFRFSNNNAKKWKTIIINAVKLFKPPRTLEVFDLAMTRHSYRQLDFDGCVASFKPVIDGLKDLIIVDDSWRRTGVWRVNQEFRPKKLGPLIELWITERKLEGH